MLCPPEGFCARCEWVRSRDGDTVEVRLRTGQVCAVRLLDCWCDKLETEAGRAAKAFLDSLLEKNDDVLRVWVQPPVDRDGDGVVDVTDLLRILTFDRVLGRLFIGTQDVSEIMVMHGYATAEKEP